jgi:hypothetical protein
MVNISDPAIQSELATIAEMHKNAKTHKEMLELENWIREKIGWTIEYRPLMRQLGIVPGNMEMRHTWSLSKSDLIWTLVDEKNIALSTANKLLYEAKKQSKIYNISLDEALNKLYTERSGNSSVCRTKTGKVAFKNHSQKHKEKSVKFAWTAVHDAIKEIIKRDMSKLDPVVHDQLMKDLEVDLKVLTQQYKTRISSNVKNGILLEDKSLKRKFGDALRNLDLPKPNKVMNQDYGANVRRIFRRKLADHHPDRHPGNDHIKNRFNEMIEVYKIVEDYLTSQDRKSVV